MVSVLLGMNPIIKQSRKAKEYLFETQIGRADRRYTLLLRRSSPTCASAGTSTPNRLSVCAPIPTHFKRQCDRLGPRDSAHFPPEEINPSALSHFRAPLCQDSHIGPW